ncbi:hypothetical protein ABZ892_07910 [Streptomyces sp. NPDC046924]|uniref:hypothetical protein n=1 Tax=Streptomyces sp. NPDC046924 TaxID=3155136 RepID=UPI00340E6834
MPSGPELMSTLELSVQAALQRRLGDLAEVVSLGVESGDDVVRVHLSYVARATGVVRADGPELFAVDRLGGGFTAVTDNVR